MIHEKPYHNLNYMKNIFILVIIILYKDTTGVARLFSVNFVKLWIRP
jgi:hypothetical protein